MSTSLSTHATKGGPEGGSWVGRKSREGANNQRKGHERARTLTELMPVVVVGLLGGTELIPECIRTLERFGNLV